MQNKRFFSEMLQKFLQFRMTTSVIKEVKRMAGGIDQYLLTTRNELLLYPKAIKLKRNLRRLARLRARDEALMAAELGGAEEGAVMAQPLAGDAAAPSPAKFYIPGLWQYEEDERIGFPWKFGKYWNKQHNARKPYMGHASRR